MQLPGNVMALARVVRAYAVSVVQPDIHDNLAGTCAAVSGALVRAINGAGFGRAEPCAGVVPSMGHGWVLWDRRLVVDLTYRQFLEDAPDIFVVELGSPKYRRYLASIFGEYIVDVVTGRAAERVLRGFEIPHRRLSEIDRDIVRMYAA